MKRGPFISKAAPPRREVTQYTGTDPSAPRVPALRIADTRARLTISLPKDRPYRSEAYRRLVAALPCAHCQRPGPSQCAHGDEGKGMAIKASDLTCFPLCADTPLRQGCHSMIGASGSFTRDQRRTLEKTYAAQTRATLGRPA